MSTLWYIGGEDIHMRLPLLLAMKDKGFSVSAIGSEDGTVFRQHNISYFRYALNRWINPISDFRSASELRSLFDKYKPDIIHCFDTKPSIIAPLVAKKVSIPVCVRTITGMGYIFSSDELTARLLKPIYRTLQRLTSRVSDVTIFQNSDDKYYFEKNKMVEGCRSELVKGSGIDIRAFRKRIPSKTFLNNIRKELNIGHNDTSIFLVARLIKDKGILEFLKAAALVHKDHPKIKFFLVGPITSEGKQAVPLSIIQSFSDHVQYLGIRNDAPALLSLADLVVLPSYYREGIPRILLEAGALGCPIITTDMPGCREIVKDGWNGWLTKPRDSKILADTIIKAIRFPKETLKKIGMNSCSYIRRDFSLDVVCNAYENIYMECLNKSQNT